MVNGKMLLTKRIIPPYKNLWNLPGGRIFYKESIASATKRILKTEVNLSPSVKPKLVGYCEFPRDGKYLHSISMVFMFVLPLETINQIRTDNQASTYKFFDKLPRNIHPIHAQCIKEHILL